MSALVHFQTGVGTSNVRSLCGLSDESPHRCLTDCDHCEGGRDAVCCPACLALARQMYDNLLYFFRADGPHATEKCGCDVLTSKICERHMAEARVRGAQRRQG